MKNIITELYNGNIQPYAKQFIRNTKYDESVAAVQECEQKLSELLTDEQFTYVEKLLDAHGDIEGILSKEHFVEGFKIGMQFLFAALSDDKSGDLRDIAEALEK